jgi:hypothetical protein
MAKVQTRRSVSTSRATYDVIKAHCESINLPMSQFLERIIIANTPEYCAAEYWLEHGHMPNGDEEYTGPDEFTCLACKEEPR